MTGEGKEYDVRRREVDEGETERVVREIIDEVRKEIEERRASEANEGQEDVKDPEQCVREAIEEIRHEEKERQRALEEWEEKHREKEEQLEESREEREEKADKDDFAELEERILENFDDYDIDPEEVKERWRERFEEEVKEQLDGGQVESEEDDGEEDERAGNEGRAVEGEVYYTDGNGQVHVVKAESDETVESKAESSLEVQEPPEESAEVADIPESQGLEPKVEESEAQPQEEQSYQTQEEDVEHPHVREHEEGQEEAEKQSSETEPKEVAPEREKTSNASDNLHPETESSLDVDETAEGHEHQKNHELGSGASDDEMGSSSELDNEHSPAQEHEHQESKESSEADASTEKCKEEPESREDEIWASYELENGSIEDEEWKRYLRELFSAISEEEREAFKEYLREQAQTIEDFEELLREYGLEELLDEEDVIEEVRQFLELMQALKANPEGAVEEIAKELDIDVEQALEWSRGESEPMSLKRLLNLEAYYLWDQIIRSYRERDLPKSREELEHGIAEHAELRTSRFLSIERAEALAWIEITGMRRRGEIKKIIRNGRELYSREQIAVLSEKYGVSKGKIVKWLRGIGIPALIGKTRQHTKNRRERREGRFQDSANEMLEELVEIENAPWEIRSLYRFRYALNHHHKLRFWESFESQFEKTENYLKRRKGRKPKLLRVLERLELRRAYEEVNGGPPTVIIESISDVEELEKRHKKLQSKDWAVCRAYFEVCANQSSTEKELSGLFGITSAMAHRWKNHIEPPPIAKLRKYEEERVLTEWARLTNVHPDFKVMDIARGESLHASRRIRVGKNLSHRNRVDCIHELSPSFRTELKKNGIRVGITGGKLYIWKPTRDLNLLDLYRDSFFYFADGNKLARFIMNIKQAQNLDEGKGLHNTMQHLNRLLSEIFPESRSKTYISLRYNQVKGEHLRFLASLSTWSTDDLESSISEIASINRIGGIANPRFPKGSELETILSRATSIVISDSHLRSNGTIEYHEQDINRIRIVEKYLQALGDIKLNPVYVQETHHYVTTLPAVIGKALLRLGLTSGDKTTHNPGLFPSILDFSRGALCALIEELVPQDGTVRPTRISWCHSHMLHPGKEGELEMSPIISQEEVEFVKKYGKPYPKYIRLSMGKLKALTKDENSRISAIASRLMEGIFRNPNNLIAYETRIAKLLGVEMIAEPQSVWFHHKTATVTISWDARTANTTEAIKLAMIAPPNDVKKREVMKRSILSKPDIADSILSMFAEQGIELEKWWSGEKVS